MGGRSAYKPGLPMPDFAIFINRSLSLRCHAKTTEECLPIVEGITQVYHAHLLQFYGQYSTHDFALNEFSRYPLVHWIYGQGRIRT